MSTVNTMGDNSTIPVITTKKAMDEFLTEFKKGQMKPAYYVQGGYRVLEVQNNDKKVQNSIKIPFTFPARSDSMYL